MQSEEFQDPVTFRLQVEPSSSPEQRLMLAILQDAVSIFLRHMRATSVLDKEKFREVERWVGSRDHDWPFSFECVCSTLGIDADYVRSGLRRARRRMRMDPASAAVTLLPRERIHSRRAWRGKVR